MTTIVRSYTMTDGDVLVPTTLNADVHSTVAGQGIYSEPNGGLSAANFDGTFQIERHLIIPGEAVRGSQDGSRFQVDFLEDAFGQVDTNNFVPIAGVSTRMYLPYDVSAMLLEWQFFYSLWRHTTNFNGPPWPAAPQVRTLAFLNGTRLAWTGAGTPETVFGSVAAGETTLLKNSEHLMAENRFGTHLALAVTAGWQELSVQLFMAPNDNGADVFIVNGVDVSTVTFNHRLTCGFRNARILTFL